MRKKRSENIISALLFSLISWGLLYIWLILVHSIGESVASTQLSSPLIFIFIITAAVSILVQKESGVLRDLVEVTLWLLSIFAGCVIFFSTYLMVMPDIDDFVFYYECFSLLFFCGLPMYLFMRMT